MHIVIVGGGFGGIKAALELSKRHIGKITLISDESYFLHHATLYSTATGKSTEESVIPLNVIFEHHPGVTVVQDTIERFDPARKLISSKKHDYRYDKLILALGSVTSFSSIPGLKTHSFNISSLQDLTEFQDHIYEEVVQKKLDKEYFVIGGGPTGVELAVALNDYLKETKELYRLKNVGSKVTLVESERRLLPHLSKTASQKVSTHLKRQKIKILLNHRVEALNKNSITIEGKSYATTTALWTSGVRTHPFFGKHKEYFQYAADGRVVVNPYLEALDDVYVIGDNSNAAPHRMALHAVHQAKRVAKNLTRLATNRVPLAYRAKHIPIGLPLGESWGYVEWFGIYAAGRTGALLRRLMELNGYRQLLPFRTALPIWRAHHLKDVD